MQNFPGNYAGLSSTGRVLLECGNSNKRLYAPIDQPEISAAFVFYHDRTEAERREWVARVFPGHLSFEVARVEQMFSAVYESQFNVFLAGSNDVARVSKMLRDHLRIIRHKPKILLVKSMSPTDRAAALMAGFDDVIDYTRAAPEEAVARTRAMMRRYENSAADAALRDLQVNTLSQIADVSALSVRERRVLEALARRCGRPVSYEFLCGQISQDVDGASARYLRVFICSLRKKLRNGASIVARLGQGYELSFDEGASS